jgi:hypothetical protein
VNGEWESDILPNFSSVDEIVKPFMRDEDDY